MIRRAWLLFLLAFVSTLAAAEKPLTLGIFAYRPASMMEEQYRMLSIYLSGALPGQRVELKFLDTEAMEAALADNQLDFVFTNPSHYVLLRHQYRLTGVIATRQTSEDGKITMASLGGAIIVRADRDDITQLADLVGKRIATPGSKFLGAYLAQAYELQQAGIPFPEGMELIDDDVIEAVLLGDADVGFVRSGLIETLEREGTISEKRFKFINLQKFPLYPYAVSTRLYPEWPFVALPHVPEDTVKRVARALLFITPDMPVAQASGIAGFTVPADYEPVQQLARVLRLPPYENPEFDVGDVWERYRWFILAGLAAGALIILLSVGLFVGNRRLRQTQSALRKLATTDGLTGLANRRHFLYLAEAELARVQRFRRPAALLLLDLDHFKSINDTHGHAAGDAVLKTFARTTRDALRKVDRVGRVGGEEFAVLLPGSNIDEGRRFAERLREQVAKSKTSINHHHIVVTVSIGIAIMRPADLGPRAVMQRADAALYRAKAAGRDRVEVEAA